MGKHMTSYQISLIRQYRSCNPPLTFQKIGKKLKRSKSTVITAYYRMKKLNASTRNIGSGRKRKTTPREDRHIYIMSLNNPFFSNKQIKKKLNLQCSRWTVGRRLLDYKLPSFFTVGKPYISRANMRKRLEWAEAHKNWNMRQWKTVLFSDESPFTLRYQQRRRIRRRRGERYNLRYLKGTIKHDKKINIWSCLSYYGIGHFYRIHGIMDRYKYHYILSRKMVPSYNKLIISKNGWFQHDNDPKHTSNLCKNYLKNKNIKVLPWPSQSPDLNPIENAWKYLDDQCIDRTCKNENELFDLLEKAWSNISIEYVQNLIRSMPRRCEAVIAANGGPTKY